jgi:hypothetical protein
MRRTWGLALAVVAATAACGDGRAVFNIDVFSFLEASDVDTIPYAAPLLPGAPDTIPVQEVQLLPVGLGESTVDSVQVTATVDFVNQTGTGTVGFAVYADTVAANVYTGTPVIQLPAVAVSGTATSQGTLSTDVIAALLPLFKQANLFIGARVTATATAPPVTGVAHVTGLRLRIVLQDQIF